MPLLDHTKQQTLIRNLCFGIIVLGLFLRLDCFIQNRSLRGDEAAYFLCNLTRTPVDIVLNTNTNPYCPITSLGFSLLEKLVCNLGGFHEYVLRSISLIFGLLSLPIFYLLLSQYSLRWVKVWAMALFALSDQLIFFSADMRIYSMDVFLVILMMWLFNHLAAEGYKSRHTIGFIFVAMISVWFSYSVIFILAGIAFVSLIQAIQLRNHVVLRKLMIIHTCWVISFLFVYFYTIFPILQADVMLPMWRKSIITTNGFYLLNGPYAARLGLFLLPCLLILISLGINALNLNNNKIRWAILIVVLVLPFLNPLEEISYSLFHGWGHADGREAIQYLKDHMVDTDGIFMNTTASFVYGYYMGYFHINMKNRWVGCIWDGFFHEKGGARHARCLFEQFLTDGNGFMTGHASYKNRPADRIYLNQWLKSSYKRQWLLLIEPTPELRNFLRSSFCHQRGRIMEKTFKDTYLYLFIDIL